MSKKNNKPIPYDPELLKQFFSEITEGNRVVSRQNKKKTIKRAGETWYIEEVVSNPGAGRNKNKDVPQSNIENFVKEKLADKDRSDFIHHDDRYGQKGNPIWNKLADEYLEENPHIEANDPPLISKRKLIPRIKEAYKKIK